MKLQLSLVGATTSVLLGMQMPASAVVLFSGSTGNMSATASFDIVGSNLQLVLTNTGAAANSSGDALLGFFFNIDGQTQAISSETATGYNPAITGVGDLLKYGAAAPIALNQSIMVPPNDGGWQYKYNSPSLGITLHNNGIASASYGIFDSTLTGGPNLSCGRGDAQQCYGIVNGFGTSPDRTINIRSPFVDKTATFNFSTENLPLDFGLKDISSVRFQWGTNLSEPSVVVIPPRPATEGVGSNSAAITAAAVPEPGTVLGSVVGGLMLFGFRIYKAWKLN